MQDETLRIVPDALWERVKARQRARAHSVGVRVKDGLSRKAAATGRQPRFVFSGWLTCSECGARFTMVNARAYACASYANGRACSNGIHVRRDLIEDRLLAGVRDTLGRDEVIEEIERRVRKVLAEAARAKPDETRIAALKIQIDNLVGAIASGGMRSSPTIGRKLAEVEAELEGLERTAPSPTVIPLMADIKARIRATAEAAGI